MKHLANLAYALAAVALLSPLAGCQTEDEVDVNRPVNESNDTTPSNPPTQTPPNNQGVTNPDTDTIEDEDVREVTP